MRTARPVTTDQPTRRNPSKRLVTLVAGLAVCWAARSSDAELEHSQLALVVRELNQVERTILEAQKLSDSRSHRYHFDYERLHGDLARVRAGIEDYLSPPRAQPRDPQELMGQYRASGPPP